MDTNPYASSGNGNSAAPTTQSPTNMTQAASAQWPGAVTNMINALMQGNAQYKQQQQKQNAAQGAQPLQGAGGGVPGAPMSLSPPQDPTSPTDPSSMSGGVGFTPPVGGVGTQTPMMSGMSMSPQAGMPIPGMPNGVNPNDPVTQALFSQIPGVSSSG